MKCGKKITIPVNLGLMVMLLVLASASGIICAGMIYLSYIYPSTPESQPYLPFIRAGIACLGVVTPIVYIICPDRYFVWLTFTPEGIEYHTLLRKKKLHPYSNYPYILRGGYLHAVIPVEFIVLTDRKLKDSELYSINQAKPSSTLIRIRYSKSIFRKLVALLPSKQCSMLIGAFHMHKDDLE